MTKKYTDEEINDFIKKHEVRLCKLVDWFRDIAVEKNLDVENISDVELMKLLVEHADLIAVEAN